MRVLRRSFWFWSKVSGLREYRARRPAWICGVLAGLELRKLELKENKSVSLEMMGFNSDSMASETFGSSDVGRELSV